MGVTTQGVYNTTYIDTPNSLSPKYYLQFQIDNGGDNVDVSSGILGSTHGNDNFIMAQELLNN